MIEVRVLGSSNAQKTRLGKGTEPERKYWKSQKLKKKWKNITLLTLFR